MHFFYIDESGDTGNNLGDQNQPVFVLGGLSVADKKWNNTKEQLDVILSEYVGGNLPAGFELHASELLSPNGDGPFAGHSIERRLGLVERLLKLPEELGHHIHLFAIDKAKLAGANCEYDTVFDNKSPYLLAFDYLITYMNWHVKENLGQFYARAFHTLDLRVKGRSLIERNGRHLDRLNSFLNQVQAKPSAQWRRQYGLRRG